MSRQLYNRSNSIQYLKRAVPPGASNYYNSSIAIGPAKTVTVSDADYAAMTINPDFISVTFVDDALIDTAEEVQALIVAAGGTTTLQGAYDLGNTITTA